MRDWGSDVTCDKVDLMGFIYAASYNLCSDIKLFVRFFYVFCVFLL